MNTYLYYPGCSLEGTSNEYDKSTRSFLEEMDFHLIELPDWTCCGATAADGISELLALALPARNLALAEKQQPSRDLLVPCSACYLNLKKVEEKIRDSAETLIALNTVLEIENLTLGNTIKVRHLLDILTNDMDLAHFTSESCRCLENLSIAPYYGCQCLRPYPVFDDPQVPISMEALIHATGAKIHSWTMGAKCCGASHMNTKMEIGLELSGAILSAASGADVIVTVCPMCHMNLAAYQKKISRQWNRDLSISILHLPQLLGLALGMTETELGLDQNLAVKDEFKAKVFEEKITT